MRYLLFTTILLLGVSSITPPQSNPSQRRETPGESFSLTAVEIAALVNECGDRTTRMFRQLLNYSYTLTDSEYEIDKRGQVTNQRSKTYEMNPVLIGKKNYFLRIQVAEDGVVFSAERVTHERERVIKELTKAEESVARGENQTTVTPEFKPRFSSYGIKVEKRGGMSRLVLFICPTDFLRSHEFYAPRRTILNDRETILLSFRPRPGYVFDKTNVPFPQGIEECGRVMAQLGGKVWIDAADKVMARLEAIPVAEITDMGAAVKDQAPLGFEYLRLQNGTWVQSRSWYNSYGRENVFLKTAASRAQKFSDFKLFKTSVEVEKLEPPREKP
jgi:hypothetical protein